MFDFVKDEIFEPTELGKCIKTFTTNISAEIAEKQEALTLTIIQRIGGDEFIDITIDKDKVKEALTDYVNKQKGIPNIEEHGEWLSLEAEIGLYSCSICGHNIIRAKCNYCPSCGAKMDGSSR